MHATRRQPAPAHRALSALRASDALRAVAAWALDVNAVPPHQRPTLAPVFVTIARAIVAPTAATFNALADELARWCQSAVATERRGDTEAPAYSDELLAPFIARAVDVAAAAGQAALDAPGVDATAS